MRRTFLTACTALILALSASSTATETREHQTAYADLDEWLKDHGLDDLEPRRTSHETFLVPAGMTYGLTVDWTTLTSTLEVLPEPFETQSGDTGGCITQYTPETRAPWAVPGVGQNEDCVPTTIKGPITSTTHMADTDGTSSATSGSYSPSPFFIHSFVIYCEPTAAEAVAWPNALVEQHCFVREFGSMPPTEWPSYRGNCGVSFGAAEGITGCVHRGA